jgi:TPR repeat protein
MQHLGRLYAHGHAGRPKDPGIAAHWYFRSWQAGNNDVEADIIRVRQDLEDVAEAGFATAQNALGLILFFGHDDAEAAAPWFEKAAAAGHPEALRMLGYLFDSGKGMPKDDGQAAEHYRRAAELGDAFAQLNLATMIDHARGGLTRDLDLAIDWLRRAADQGLHQAELRLAELLAERNRDRNDLAEAIQRLWRTAKDGPQDGQYRLAAGNGTWAITMTRAEGIVGLHGLTPEEVKGLVQGKGD